MIISQMNKQHNNKIATDRYIKEKKLLIMRYSNFSFYVMKISYDLFLLLFSALNLCRMSNRNLNWWIQYGCEFLLLFWTQHDAKQSKQIQYLQISVHNQVWDQSRFTSFLLDYNIQENKLWRTHRTYKDFHEMLYLS